MMRRAFLQPSRTHTLAPRLLPRRPLAARLSCPLRRPLSSSSSGAEAKLKHVPFGEAGSGAYSDATKGCFDVMQRLGPLVFRELQTVLAARKRAGTASANNPFRLLDIGTADAGTSLPLVREIIARVREAEPAVAVEVVYEDQAHNDWISVFRRTQGDLPTQGAPQGLADLENVSVLASGQSFFKPCTAPGTVDLAISSTAMHWLTSSPCTIPDALHSACTEDPETQAAFLQQAEADWRSILAARAAELKSGGALVVANFAKDVDGQFLGHTPARVKHSMHHAFARIWASLVTTEEFAATNFPNQYRSLDECTKPFGGVEGKTDFHGLELVSAETAVVPCPFLESYRRNPSALTPREQAETYVGTTRTWSNSTFLSGLAPSRSPEEGARLVDELFSQYVRDIASEPEEHGMDYVHSYLAVRKK